MKAMEKDWYKKIWTLDIRNMSWVEDTKYQVDFLIEQLGFKGNERILDIACGFGRHALEFARRGYEVVGVDITQEYIDYANKRAKEEQLKAVFICDDVRNVAYEQEFDVVLNMADGAIGYLENDEENSKIFTVIARALKHGGKHFMDIMNGNYASTHFPCKLWDAGENGITLSVFEWNQKSRIMLYGQADYLYGEKISKPEIQEGNPIRLYTLNEISEIFSKLGMTVCKSYADFNGKIGSDNDIQLMVCSVKG